MKTSLGKEPQRKAVGFVAFLLFMDMCHAQASDYLMHAQATRSKIAQYPGECQEVVGSLTTWAKWYECMAGGGSCGAEPPQIGWSSYSPCCLKGMLARGLTSGAEAEAKAAQCGQQVTEGGAQGVEYTAEDRRLDEQLLKMADAGLAFQQMIESSAARAMYEMSGSTATSLDSVQRVRSKETYEQIKRELENRMRTGKWDVGGGATGSGSSTRPGVPPAQEVHPAEMGFSPEHGSYRMFHTSIPNLAYYEATKDGVTENYYVNTLTGERITTDELRGLEGRFGVARLTNTLPQPGEMTFNGAVPQHDPFQKPGNVPMGSLPENEVIPVLTSPTLASQEEHEVPSLAEGNVGLEAYAGAPAGPNELDAEVVGERGFLADLMSTAEEPLRAAAFGAFGEGTAQLLNTAFERLGNGQDIVRGVKESDGVQIFSGDAITERIQVAADIGLGLREGDYRPVRDFAIDAAIPNVAIAGHVTKNMETFDGHGNRIERAAASTLSAINSDEDGADAYARLESDFDSVGRIDTDYATRNGMWGSPTVQCLGLATVTWFSKRFPTFSKELRTLFQ